jgi:hypothetical protein
MLNAPSPATSAKNKRKTAARCKRIERGCHMQGFHWRPDAAL